MPFTTRRSLLAVGALALTGCSPALGSGSAAKPRSQRSADRIRARTAADSAALLARYDATLAVHPGLAGRLKPLRAETARHLAALGGAESASASVSPTARGGADAPDVPPKERKALSDLERAEEMVAARRFEDLREAPGELARLLASLAASGAVHQHLLNPEDS